VAEIKSYRRYCLGKRRHHALLADDYDTIWKAKQEAEPGTALPADFPQLTALDAAGYTTDVDLDGADANELITAGFTRREAEAVLSAFESLP
jgi:hypothetical protein